jgi:uncharacterized alpha/beta hydrolase family protein
MKQFGPDQKFTILSHSMGSVVAYYLTTMASMFPLAQLSNMISLAGPLQDSPMMLSYDISALLKKINYGYKADLSNNVAHINFHGGPRDQMVPTDLSGFGRFRE